MPERTYSQEEVEAILDRALKAQAKDGARLTHDELVAAAGEVGIPKTAIDAAARDLESRAPNEPTDAAIVAAWKKRARLGFLRHVVTYLLVGAMLALINFASGASFLWFPIVLLGWGVGVAMHLMSLLFADEERIVERERRRLARRARRERWKRRSADFERAVDQGVRALLDMANQRGARVDVPRGPSERVRVGGEPEAEPEAEAEDEQKLRR
jgi:hypothetical protein